MSNRAMLSETHWPTDGTESVPACPICGSRKKERMHDQLSDLTFKVAPGIWTMVRCKDCRSGYLDPRPTAATIGLAYASYYTHEETGTNRVGAIAKFRQGIAIAYANKKFGTRFSGAIVLGHIFARLFPRLSRYLDVRYGRHLPKPIAGKRRLLDVGCGNGEFLASASAMGWTAEGIDVDPAAIATATSSGYSAKQVDLSDPSLKQGHYDQITLSHVIEHMASPQEQLSRCLTLLAPGGRLWLQTPNIDSLGHAVFGPAWRGLEPPRHLMIFNPIALQKLLSDIGYVNIEFKTHPAVSLFMWEESRRILKQMPHLQKDSIGNRLRRVIAAAIIADYWSLIRPNSAEFITCIAYRPPAPHASAQ